MIAWDKVDFLCVLSRSASFQREALQWLEKDEKRRLALIYDPPEEIQCLSSDNPRVKIYHLQSPLQIEPLAKEIAWEAVFLEMQLIGSKDHPLFETLKKRLEYYHLGANLALSDGADCGLLPFKNSFSRMRRPLRSALGLKGAFEGIPAVIVGAGPSLEKNKDQLKKISERALILAGGTALNLLDFPPHFGAFIDSQTPYQQLKKAHLGEIPICFQTRVSAEIFSLIHGEALRAPESHFSFLNWLEGEESSFDGGWTVGNFLMALASLWGCNPIVFVGMDFCYHGERKYAAEEMAGEEKLCFANGVWTKRDWLMAKQWTEQLANQCNERVWINATEGGMGFSEPIAAKKIEEIDFGAHRNLTCLVHRAIHSLPQLIPCEGRWEIWKKSLQRSAILCEQLLAEDTSFLDCASFDLKWEDEIVYEKFLYPLWQLWKPIFTRELDLDPHPVSREKKLHIHRSLFFQQAIQEQLNVLR
jgi:hypothetical protein